MIAFCLMIGGWTVVDVTLFGRPEEPEDESTTQLAGGAGTVVDPWVDEPCIRLGFR